MVSRRPPRLIGRPTHDPWAGTPLDIYRSNYASFLREARRILAPEGLLLTDVRALHCLSEGPTRPTALAARLDLTPAAATQLIDRLEGKRLVRRSADPRDRRATALRLTGAGERACARKARMIRSFLLEITREMSPEGLEALRRGSEELAHVLAERGAA